MGGCLRLEGQMLRVNRSGACIHRGLEAAGAYPITFAQLVQAAEKCTAMIIHPGTPLNPNEPDLDQWIQRAERFN